MERSLHEARALGRPHVESEHILLAITRVDEGFAVRALVELGAAPQLVVDDVLKAFGSSAGSAQLRDH